MSLASIRAGDYGQKIQLTVLDTDTNAAADVSAYATAQLMIFKNHVNVDASKVAAFATDGSDGVVEYTLIDGDIPSTGAGNWQVCVRLTSATAQLTSTWLSFEILE